MTAHHRGADHALMAIRDSFPGTRVLAPLPSSPDELIDEMLGCYAEWREEVEAVDEAYRLWCTALSDDRDVCFGVYVAAVDQEESAAMAYAVVAEEVRALLQRAAEDMTW